MKLLKKTNLCIVSIFVLFLFSSCEQENLIENDPVIEGDESIETFDSTISAKTYGNGTAAYSAPSIPGTPKLYSTKYYPTSTDAKGIQAAIDAASAAGGGTVSLSATTYNIGKTITLKSKVSIIGAGIGSTILKRHSNFSGYAFGTGSGHIAMLESQDASLNNVVIRKMTIDGNWSDSYLLNNQPALGGIAIGATAGNYNSFIRIREVEIKSFGAMALSMSGTTSIRLEALSLHNSGAHSLWHNLYFRRCGKIYMSGCTVYNSLAGNGLKFSGGTFANHVDESKNITIRNTNVYDNAKNNCVIRGFENVRVYGCKFEGQETVSNSYHAGLLLAIENGYGCKYADVINNEMLDNANYGFRLEDSSDINIEGNVSTGNGKSHQYSVYNNGNSNWSCDFNKTY